MGLRLPYCPKLSLTEGLWNMTESTDSILSSLLMLLPTYCDSPPKRQARYPIGAPDMTACGVPGPVKHQIALVLKIELAAFNLLWPQLIHAVSVIYDAIYYRQADAIRIFYLLKRVFVQNRNVGELAGGD